MDATAQSGGQSSSVATVVPLADPAVTIWLASQSVSCATVPAQADDPAPWKATDFFDPNAMLFGPELEFTGGYGMRPSATSRQDYIAEVLKLAAEDEGVVAQMTKNDSGITISKPAIQMSFTVYPYEDPSVLEIPISPLSLREMIVAAPYIQKYVYDAAAHVDLLPGTAEVNRWSAHTNISWPAMREGKDVDLFMRFFVDMQNAAELWMGGLGSRGFRTAEG